MRPNCQEGLSFFHFKYIHILNKNQTYFYTFPKKFFACGAEPSRPGGPSISRSRRKSNFQMLRETFKIYPSFLEMLNWKDTFFFFSTSIFFINQFQAWLAVYLLFLSKNKQKILWRKNFSRKEKKTSKGTILFPFDTQKEVENILFLSFISFFFFL